MACPHCSHLQHAYVEVLEFLLQHKLPIQVLKIAFYVDQGSRRFLNVEWELEPEASPTPEGGDSHVFVGDASGRRDFREVTLSEVTQTLETPTTRVWNRPRKGRHYEATLLEGGVIRLSDGRQFRSPSGSIVLADEMPSATGT